MQIMNIIIIIGLAIIAVFVFLVGLIIVISLDSAFHKIKKVKPLTADINLPGNHIVLIGHSTVLIQMDGLNIITDPMFSKRILKFSKRYVEPGIAFEDLPKIDAILISHAHYDHLDRSTLARFSKDTPVLISKGNGKILEEWGFSDIKELEPDESVKIEDVKIIATPAKHSGSRNSPFADFPKALGYVVQGSKTIYFAGDTGMFEGLKKIGDSFKIEVAMLPIGSFRPVWFMKRHHMGPDDIPQAMRELQAETVMPIHWGAFRMALDGMEEPREKMQEIINRQDLDSKIKILEPGGIFNL